MNHCPHGGEYGWFARWVARWAMVECDRVSGLDELKWRTLTRLAGRFKIVKAIVSPILFAFSFWVAWADGAAWRLVTMVVVTALLLFGGLMHRRVSFPHIRHATYFDLPVLTILQGFAIAVTGGLGSPLLPVMFAPAFMSALFADRRAAQLVMMFQLISIWAYALLELQGIVQLIPTMFLSASGEPPAAVEQLSVAIAMTIALLIAHVLGVRSQEAVDAQIAQALRARDSALANYSERTHELTTLSGEIAHELKNPLASVKGLAALVGKDLEGKPAERIAVLRREVDRMQSILDEFLNFSRPLVPLALRTVPVRGIASEVADLHEGMAGEQQVEISVGGDHGAELRCDPRKIKQILVNLLQNALEVAPAGSRVELNVQQDRDDITVEVLDEGPGLDPKLGGRAFDAGFTTKDTGSGLGLTLARALAHQHGGDLHLHSRATGVGCRGILRLPRGGPETAVAADDPCADIHGATP